MVSSRWQKQDYRIGKVGLGITVGIATLLELAVSILRLGSRSGLIALLVLAVGVTVVGIINKRYAKPMVRILKFEYEEMLRYFRILFKENHIRFFPRREEFSFLYAFPGWELSMTVEHYSVQDMHMGKLQSFSKVTLNNINETNQTFADKLANLIDEMENQRASNEK